MAVTGTVISAIATVGSLYQGYQSYQRQEEAQDAQEEANEISQRSNQLQQQENIRRAIARSRVARAQQEAAGAAAGGGGASVATQGSAGGESTGTAANIGFAIGQNELQNQRFDLLIDAGQSMQDANRAQAIGGFLGSASQFDGGGAGFANLARYGYKKYQDSRGEG